MIQKFYSHGREFDTERDAVEHSVYLKFLGMKTSELIKRRTEAIEWLLDIDRAENRDRARDAAAGIVHYSDCAVNNAPALPVGPCNCSAKKEIE